MTQEVDRFEVCRPAAYWIEPILDREISGTGAGPEETASLRQSIRLARRC